MKASFFKTSKIKIMKVFFCKNQGKINYSVDLPLDDGSIDCCVGVASSKKAALRNIKEIVRQDKISGKLGFIFKKIHQS